MLTNSSNNDHFEFDIPSYIENPKLLEEYSACLHNELMKQKQLSSKNRYVYNQEKKVIQLYQPQLHQSILYPRMTVKGKKTKVMKRNYSSKPR